MSALPFCVDESELPFHEPLLPVPGAACSSWLLRALSLSPARQGEFPAQPLWVAHGALCPVLALLWRPGDGHPPLPCPAALHPAPHSFAPPDLSPPGSHGSLGSSAAVAGAGDSTGDRKPPRGLRGAVGRGLGDRAAHRPPVPLPGPTGPFITPLPFIGPDRCPQINTPRQ